MKIKEEIKQWLLENCVDEDGDLDLSELDFSNFGGDVIINNWKVSHNLYQDSQKVKGNLYQGCQKVTGDLYQNVQTVEGILNQSEQEVGKDLFQDNQIVKGDIWQRNQQFKGILHPQVTSDLMDVFNDYWGIAYINKEKKK